MKFNKPRKYAVERPDGKNVCAYATRGIIRFNRHAFGEATGRQAIAFDWRAIGLMPFPDKFNMKSSYVEVEEADRVFSDLPDDFVMPRKNNKRTKAVCAKNNDEMCLMLREIAERVRELESMKKMIEDLHIGLCGKDQDNEA